MPRRNNKIMQFFWIRFIISIGKRYFYLNLRYKYLIESYKIIQLTLNAIKDVIKHEKTNSEYVLMIRNENYVKSPDQLSTNQNFGIKNNNLAYFFISPDSHSSPFISSSYVLNHLCIFSLLPRSFSRFYSSLSLPLSLFSYFSFVFFS